MDLEEEACDCFEGLLTFLMTISGLGGSFSTFLFTDFARSFGSADLDRLLVFAAVASVGLWLLLPLLLLLRPLFLALWLCEERCAISFMAIGSVLLCLFLSVNMLVILEEWLEDLLLLSVIWLALDWLEWPFDCWCLVLLGLFDLELCWRVDEDCLEEDLRGCSELLWAAAAAAAPPLPLWREDLDFWFFE